SLLAMLVHYVGNAHASLRLPDWPVARQLLADQPHPPQRPTAIRRRPVPCLVLDQLDGDRRVAAGRAPLADVVVRLRCTACGKPPVSVELVEDEARYGAAAYGGRPMT